VFLDHFPDGGRQDGWIADDYLRTYLTQNGLSRVTGARPDDVFVINDADEIPAREGLLFLKLFDGWTEPFAIHMRKVAAVAVAVVAAVVKTTVVALVNCGSSGGSDCGSGSGSVIVAAAAALV